LTLNGFNDYIFTTNSQYFCAQQVFCNLKFNNLYALQKLSLFNCNKKIEILFYFFYRPSDWKYWLPFNFIQVEVQQNLNKIVTYWHIHLLCRNWNWSFVKMRDIFSFKLVWLTCEPFILVLQYFKLIILW
jgi:hypothetical protein